MDNINKCVVIICDEATCIKIDSRVFFEELINVSNWIMDGIQKAVYRSTKDLTLSSH